VAGRTTRAALDSAARVAYNPAAVEKNTRKLAECVVVPAEALRGKRWDPGYWISPSPAGFAAAGELAERMAQPELRPPTGFDSARGTAEGMAQPELRPPKKLRPPAGLRPPVPWAALGDFIERITYGPIITGRRPQAVAEGVAIVDQKVLRPTGVLLDQAVRVAEGCEYDLPRCRLPAGDLLVARSGAGTLRKKRFTVYREAAKATVSCFVDRVRLFGVNPYYVATVLRSRFVWPQIERLANGVGTPNLSFGEIRSLRIPVASEAEQSDTERAWEPIREAHAAGDLAAAEALLDAVVARLEERLMVRLQANEDGMLSEHRS